MFFPCVKTPKMCCSHDPMAKWPLNSELRFVSNRDSACQYIEYHSYCTALLNVKQNTALLLTLSREFGDPVLAPDSLLFPTTLKSKIHVSDVLEALIDGWCDVSLLEAAKRHSREHTSPFRVHQFRIERPHAVIVLTEPRSGCKVHATHWDAEVLSKTEPARTSVHGRVCVVNSHGISCV